MTGGRVAAAGDGAIDTLVARGVEGLGEFGDGGRFAARCPPMRDFQVGRHSRDGGRQKPQAPHLRRREHRTHFSFSQKSETLQKYG